MIRPPKNKLKQIGKEWAKRMEYRIYANGKIKTKRGVIFKNLEEVGRCCVKGGIVRKIGRKYELSV